MVDLNEVERQARAEVLAAHLAELKKLEIEATKNEAYGIRKACQTLAYQFRRIQPAAQDLEELLQKGWDKFAVLQMHVYELLGDLHEKEGSDIVDSMKRVEADLERLEKARAILEKS